MRHRSLRSLALLAVLLGSRLSIGGAAAADTRTSYTFQAVFLLAEISGAGSLEGVPANAQKALRDAASFLPYKNYRLLDLAWIRTSFKGSARFAGPDGRGGELLLTVDPAETSKDKLVIHELTVQPLNVSGLAEGRPLLSSTFSLAPGETVIVGTSKLDGPGKALVVLLTAIP